jgi:hypothetical protein
MARTRQPQGVPRFAGPIGSKFCAGFVAGGSGVITTLNQSLAPVGTGSMQLAGTPQGLAVKSTAQDNRYQPLWPSSNATATPWERPTTAITAVVFCRRTGTQFGEMPIFGNVSPTTAPYYSWQFANSGTGTNVSFGVAANTGNQWAIATAGLGDTLPHVFVGVWTVGGYCQIFKDGVFVNAASVAESNPISYPNGADRGPAVGNWWGYTGNRSFIGEVYGGAIAPVALSATEIAEISRTPQAFWSLFAPSRRVVVFGAGAGGEPTAVTGTLAATDGADAAAFAATHAVPAVTAALAATDGADAAAFAATHTVPAVTAALAATDGADAAAFAGESSATPVTATLAATDGADIAAFAATHQISVTATLAATDGADIAAFVATHIASVTAALAATDGADICAFAATHAQAIIATFAATEGADVATFTGRTAGTSIWTDVGVSAATWSDVGPSSSIWTDI